MTIFALYLACICLIIRVFKQKRKNMHLIAGAGDVKMNKTQSLCLGKVLVLREKREMK